MREGYIYQQESVKGFNVAIEMAEDTLRKMYPSLVEVFAADMTSLLEGKGELILFIEVKPKTEKAEIVRIASDLERIIGRDLKPLRYRPWPDDRDLDEWDEEPVDILSADILKEGERRDAPLTIPTPLEKEG